MAPGKLLPPAAISSDSSDYEILKFSYNADTDSLTRISLPSKSIEEDPLNTKDIPLNHEKQTWVRLFKPLQLIQNHADPINIKLPVIIYFHGGGFVYTSAASNIFHDFCALMATQLRALVVSVDHRLAPENRLPAAYEDAIDAIRWLRNQALDVNNNNNSDHGAELWLRDYANFSQCFLMGSSSGANIAYYAGLRALELDLEPVKIRGLILNQPYFGGTKRTKSEIKLMHDEVLPLALSDLMWELSLPRGCNRDHVFSNPMAHVDDDGGEKSIRRAHIELKTRGIRFFVDGRVGDPLIDRQMEFVKMLEGDGVEVVMMSEEGFHGMELRDKKKAEKLIGAIKGFISDGSVVQNQE